MSNYFCAANWVNDILFRIIADHGTGDLLFAKSRLRDVFARRGTPTPWGSLTRQRCPQFVVRREFTLDVFYFPPTLHPISFRRPSGYHRHHVACTLQVYGALRDSRTDATDY